MDGIQDKEGSKGRNGEQSSCPDCQRPDSAEDMVQCDHCDVWKHFTCASVNASVAGRAFVCGDCSAQHSDDAITVHSESSRASSTSVFSVCLSQLVERQHMERARMELELQRRHLDEQQKLIDKALGGEEAENHHSDGLSGGTTNEVTPPAPSKRLATPPPPGAPLASSDRRSKALSDTPKSAAPVVVSIPLTALEPNSVKLLQGMKDPQVALRELRARVELCEKRANPTPDDLVDLQAQLELCRKILEGIQTSTSTNESVQRPDASSTMKLQPPKPAASTSRMVKQTGAIPKTNRSLLTVPQEDLMQPNSPSQEGAVGGANRPSDIWPLKMPVSQSGGPSVSRAFESSKMRPNLLEPPGKRQALSNLFENTTLYASGDCPTTNFPTTREQQRVDARPGESCLPPTHSHEQLRDTLAHSGYATLPYSQPERNSTGMQTRNCPSRVVESTPPPRQSDSSQPNQVISQPDPFRPTQQQLAARQSLAKDLPRFSGDPAEWPIFISNYRYTTEACGFSDGENMLRLQRCLTGSALETVRSRLVLPAAVPQVIETLRMRFGRPELLINALLRKVRDIPAPRPDRLEGLIDFGMAVQALCDHIEAANERAHLSNPSLLQKLVAKLPADQRMMWAGYKRGFPHADLKTFGDYMSSVVRDATSVVTFEPETRRSGARDRPRQKGFINSHATESSSRSGDSSREPKETPKQFDCAHCNKCGHRVRDCNAFKQLNVDDRWRRVRSLGLCQNCLFSHGRRACRGRKTCDIEGCQFRHHPLLHSPRGPPKSSERTMQVAENHTHRRLTSPTLFRIIPVTLHGTKGSINTFAFLDEGSDLTLIESDLVASLGVKGTKLPLCLRWTGNTSRVEKESQQITIEIAGIGQDKRHKLLNARTVNSLGLPRQTFEVENAVKKHKHLQGIPLSTYRDAVPKILIGVDNLRLALPLKVREGDGPAPVAVKTRLGWCVYGPRGSSSLESHSFHICECSCDETLHEAVKDFFAIEGAGAGPTATSMKKEDERALTIMEATTHRVGNRFETGLIWKEDHVEFPNSYSMAVRRLECLERRMERDPGLKENLHRQIQEYEAKGYAHKATAAEMEAADPRRVWHLPVGAVINPKKPGKVRVIWDAAAKVDGVSLNSALLKGPDQLSSLPAILFRFRLYQVAVSSDIQEMFHQIQIREADKNSQRFLWRNNPSEKPTVYLMDVATFGSTCSPASAQFVKNRNAEQHLELYPEAVKAIIDDHYVDDYLASFGTEEEAAKVARDVRHVHGNGGFKLHNWRSNSCTVLERLGEVPLAEEKQLKLVDGVATERVLGMLWCPSTDELSFSTQMSEEVQALIKTSTRPTKRQVLRCVMTLFDPLGLLSPFLIHGKVLIQDIWREGTEWDEQVSADVFAKWRRWVQMIEYISGVRIPRCYFRLANQKTYHNCELHVFVDASEVAYSCAIYLRTLDTEAKPQCCLIAAKSKVAPLKPWSIPRLELQGCVLGVRWSKFVRENHGVPVSKMVFWTDSRTALAWIMADPRNYRQFVSFRVAEILEHTTASDWRWVPSKSNPADEATKWGSGPYFNPNSKWFQGPEFLRLPETEWPRPKEPVTATSEEIRASILYHCSIEPVIDFVRQNADEICRTTTAAKLRAAEITIFKLVQRESYPDEIAALSTKASNETGQEAIGKQSSIYRLMPILDENGLLRERGRIGAAGDICYSVRHPIILPRKHQVTELLVYRYHQQYRHGNAETVVNEIRQMYNIPRLRLVVKKVSRDCPFCKIRRARPAIPPMAPLPAARLAHHERAFTYTGVDYFGPLLVKLGRSNVKRWIALFTCLTVRAVHLEVAYTLSTESCISCVRRFVGRRGSPAEFFSDNGTNFQGAERVLQHQISQGLSATFTNTDTKWNFIPPGAPHMGGAWERLVQSVKVAIAEAYSEGKLDDEGLQTLVVEAEHMVNSRPLTYLPLEAVEAEALTPNHFLLLSSSSTKQYGREAGSTVHGSSSELIRREILGRSWELIQRQLNVFWKRWLTEYLPVIRRQPKWFDETRSLVPGDLVLVAEPTKRNGWERGRIIRVVPSPDGRYRRAVVQIGTKTLLRPVSRLALLDLQEFRETPEDSGPHPGETVGAGIGKLATLPCAATKASRPRTKATQRYL
ncbi:uncharacterized protein LOC134290847 [Aedes albopictus]|uniref:Integrase catalytic domain-containing protein n=1 Tax=Aedes albopictus TaxID=7160 RepID=A0ABM1ZPU0_AEDAL